MIPALVVAVVICLGLAGLAARGARERRQLSVQLRATRRELERLQAAFGRFAPPRLVERIIDTGAGLTAERRPVTVLFADLQGFTALTERLASAMSETITAHHGHVNRFLGDGLMALFGALESNPWLARDAVEASLAMRSALSVYNETLSAEGLPSIRVGIGINCGEAVVGVVGHESLLQFDVLGDTVNVAARVESLTRTLGADILVTDAVRALLDGQYLLREMPPASVKGKSLPVLTFAVEGRKEG